MTNKIQILDSTSQSIIGEIEVFDTFIGEKVNDKYTFDFSCNKQDDTGMLAQETLIYVDNDYFRIAMIREYPVLNKFEVSCEHISYELNVITAEEAEEEAEDLLYEGKIWDIMNEILEGTNFVYFHSDDINDVFKFVTKQKGIRSRIIEFCKEHKFEVHWFRFQVSVQRRRGGDHGLEIALGENLRDLSIDKVFNFDGTITSSYNIGFIDLNKIFDDEGQPLKNVEFHMGDTVYLKIGSRTIVQRGVYVGYDPFRKELPVIELESPSKTLTEVIADGAVVSGGSPSTGNGGTLETASGAFSNGLEFRFTKPYDNLYSVTVSTTKPSIVEGTTEPVVGAAVYYSEVKNAENKYVGVKVHAVEPLNGVTVSMQAVVK